MKQALCTYRGAIIEYGEPIDMLIRVWTHYYIAHDYDLKFARAMPPKIEDGLTTQDVWFLQSCGISPS